MKGRSPMPSAEDRQLAPEAAPVLLLSEKELARVSGGFGTVVHHTTKHGGTYTTIKSVSGPV